jgi:hypothetical protein
MSLTVMARCAALYFRLGTSRPIVYETTHGDDEKDLVCSRAFLTLAVEMSIDYVVTGKQLVRQSGA